MLEEICGNWTLVDFDHASKRCIAGGCQQSNGLMYEMRPIYGRYLLSFWCPGEPYPRPPGKAECWLWLSKFDVLFIMWKRTTWQLNPEKPLFL